MNRGRYVIAGADDRLQIWFLFDKSLRGFQNFWVGVTEEKRREIGI